jgi:Ala-tRNA(Pro) deacylase
MPVRKLKEYLDSHQVKYVTIGHSPAYSAQEIAASAHIPGRALAMLKVDGKMAMAVLPASCQVDFDMFEEATGGRRVEMATEKEFEDLFPECELGAMPPFGNLYGMEVFVDETLANDEEIAFNAGSHTELVRMSYRDFWELVSPTVVRCTSPVR